MKVLLDRIVRTANTKKGSLAILFLVYFFGVAVIFFVLAPTAYGPVHHGDETEYWEIAYALFSGNFTISEFHYPPIFYPLSILPAFIMAYPDNAYLFAKLLNAIYISSVIFPSYFILRKFADRGLSLLAAAIILVFPINIVIPRLLLSENVYYPLFMWAACLSFRALSQPGSKLRFLENIIFGVTLGLMALTRNIALGLIPVFLLVWWIRPDEGEKLPLLISWSKTKQAIVVGLALIFTLGIWVLWGAFEGVTISQLLGMDLRAASSDPLQMTKTNLFRWAVFYIAHSVQTAGPFLGILPMAVFLVRWRSLQEDLTRWFIAAGLITAAILVICIHHSWQVDADFEQLMGRYLLYEGPLFFIAAIAAMKKLKFPNLHASDWGYWTYSLIAAGVLVLAYAIQYQELFFLDRALETSGSSPYGYLIRSWGDLFIPVSILIIFLTTWFLGRNEKPLMGIFLIMVITFNLIGDVLMYQQRLILQQNNTIQANHIVKAIQKGPQGEVIGYDHPITISAEPGAFGVNMAVKFSRTFRFFGYRNFEIVEDERLAGEPEAYQIVQAGGYEFRVDGADREEYLNCDCEKYEFLDKYYTVTARKIQ